LRFLLPGLNQIDVQMTGPMGLSIKYLYTLMELLSVTRNTWIMYCILAFPLPVNHSVQTSTTHNTHSGTCGLIRRTLRSALNSPRSYIKLRRAEPRESWTLCRPQNVQRSTIEAQRRSGRTFQNTRQNILTDLHQILSLLPLSLLIYPRAVVKHSRPRLLSSVRDAPHSYRATCS
jgi:hypothetical protein